MGEPFIGEIRMFGGNFAPAGWAFCQGQLIPISENDALFTLIGTTYGGDGQETFGIPNLQGRVPMHAGKGPGVSQTYQLGELAGVEAVTLTTNQIPIHNHAVIASTNVASSTTASGNVTAASNQLKIYDQGGTSKLFANNALTPVGGSQPHENMQPYLAISFILSLFGVFPTQS